MNVLHSGRLGMLRSRRLSCFRKGRLGCQLAIEAMPPLLRLLEFVGGTPATSGRRP